MIRQVFHYLGRGPAIAGLQRYWAVSRWDPGDEARRIWVMGGSLVDHLATLTLGVMIPYSRVPLLGSAPVSSSPYSREKFAN